MNSIWMYKECCRHEMWVESESQSVCFTFGSLNFQLFQLVFLIRDIPLVSSIERHAIREIILKTEIVNTCIFERNHCSMALAVRVPLILSVQT